MPSNSRTHEREIYGTTTPRHGIGLCGHAHPVPRSLRRRRNRRRHGTATDGESETDAGSTADNDAADTGDGDAITNTDTTNEDDMTPITITVNGASFDAQLASTPAAQAFARMLPLSLTMDELNGNEKYHYLDTSLPAEAQSVGSIATGDLMLYGSSCVVLFYDSFRTSYTYTRLGRVADPAGLADALGSGSVTVTFEAA